jgi:hypothetical protein
MKRLRCVVMLVSKLAKEGLPWTLVCVLIAIALLQYHKSVVSEAETHASVWLLGQFHASYLREHRILNEDYVRELRAFGRQHSSLKLLDQYVQTLEGTLKGE